MKPSLQAGYNLVMLMVLLTVLNIAVAASLPSWTSIIRRDKEEELIFRGLQYAEAIRVFQNRFQRSPVRLEELIEVEPRSIRQMWKDPMTENGKWALIPLQGPTGMEVPPGQDQQDQQDDQDDQDGDDDDGRDGDSGDDGGGFGPKEGELQIGPFKGVRSRSSKTSFLLFNGKDRYDEWHFTIDLLLGSGQPIAAGGEGGVVGVPPPVQPGIQQQQPMVSARWIGRPLPAFLTPRQDSGLPEENNSFGNRDQDQNGRRRSSGKP